MPPHPNKKWLTPGEAAEYCGLSLEELRSLARLGEIPCKRRGQRGHRRYHRKYLDAWLEDGNVTEAQVQPRTRKRRKQREVEAGDSPADWFVHPDDWGAPSQ